MDVQVELGPGWIGFRILREKGGRSEDGKGPGDGGGPIPVPDWPVRWRERVLVREGRHGMGSHGVKGRHGGLPLQER